MSVPPDDRTQPALGHRRLNGVGALPLNCGSAHRGSHGRLIHPLLALDTKPDTLVLVKVEICTVAVPDPGLFVDITGEEMVSRLNGRKMVGEGSSQSAAFEEECSGDSYIIEEIQSNCQ